ncbi:SH3 and multiple ankyrin repeat domains protein 1-like [Amphibalanus amphitrite]|uniref:SH3 and multiple ankyrin repeat domains protein 1-like n=1 Tax=Amphibalanus amphitrite TaxID=1232801 RepID=UPI001C928479|nr:SH3 and multiple ankyrin repeat domains protein 1-like [Amphibalanus amphitrite]XP_043195093.1 SH3 and multiple ankyrin repeat domains protein 1-like [Amphibalanus amphitrite]XP_043195094.1 SH3 and multiple ankyrin repeat domains protein 1-like [Amphibalanus amphitrite]
MGRLGAALDSRQGPLATQSPATMTPRPPKKRYLMEYPARFGSPVTEMSRPPTDRTGPAVSAAPGPPPQPAPPSAHHHSAPAAHPPHHPAHLAPRAPLGTANGSVNGGPKRRLSDDAQPLNLTLAATTAAPAPSQISAPPPVQVSAPATTGRGSTRPPPAPLPSDPETEVQFSSLMDRVVEGMLPPRDPAETERQGDPLRLWFTNEFDSRQQPAGRAPPPPPPKVSNTVTVQSVTSVPTALVGGPQKTPTKPPPPPTDTRHYAQDMAMDMSKPARSPVAPGRCRPGPVEQRLGDTAAASATVHAAAERTGTERPDGDGVEVKIGMSEAINRVIDSVYRRDQATAERRSPVLGQSQQSAAEERLAAQSPARESNRERAERGVPADRSSAPVPSAPLDGDNSERPRSAGPTIGGGPADPTASPAALNPGSKIGGVASPLRKGKKRCLPVDINSAETPPETESPLGKDAAAARKRKVGKDDIVRIQKDDVDSNGSDSPSRSRDPPKPPMSGQ